MGSARGSMWRCPFTTAILDTVDEAMSWWPCDSGAGPTILLAVSATRSGRLGCEHLLHFCGAASVAAGRRRFFHRCRGRRTATFGPSRTSGGATERAAAPNRVQGDDSSARCLLRSASVVTAGSCRQDLARDSMAPACRRPGLGARVRGQPRALGLASLKMSSLEPGHHPRRITAPSPTPPASPGALEPRFSRHGEPSCWLDSRPLPKCMRTSRHEEPSRSLDSKPSPNCDGAARAPRLQERSVPTWELLGRPRTILLVTSPG
jgi:hypothetical protein